MKDEPVTSLPEPLRRLVQSHKRHVVAIGRCDLSDGYYLDIPCPWHKKEGTHARN